MELVTQPAKVDECEIGVGGFGSCISYLLLQNIRNDKKQQKSVFAHLV